MCGIAGILKQYPPGEPVPHHVESIPEKWLDILDESIKHRGPDGQGRFRDRAVRDDGTTVDVAFVHRRLSIIDHEGGHQPMVHDGEHLRPDLTYQPGEEPKLAHELCPGKPLVAVVFNGCIYNHRELRAELEAQGHVFETDHSDTEVLVHGWRAWRHSLTERLSSMHAFATWCRLTGSLFTSRDHFGEKPLYHAGNSESSLFASTAGAVLSTFAGNQYDPEIGSESIIEWIALGQHPTTTPCIGTEQVPPGAWTINFNQEHGSLPPVSTLGSQQSHQSFRLSDASRLSPDAAADAVETALFKAVQWRLDADVPVVCFLSGGIDSSLVALYAQRALLQNGRQLKTLCVRMSDDRYDESSVAKSVADVIGTAHEEVEPSTEPASDLIHLIESIGVPFSDSSLLPTYWVSRAASEVAGVALSGDGGDELFIGYERQMVAGDLVPLSFLAGAASTFAGAVFPRRNPRGKWHKAARLLTASSKISYRSLIAIFQHPELRRLTPSTASLCRWNDRVNDVMAARQYDLENYLPGDLLRKVDSAGMACPIEVRCPMLDADLCAQAMSFDTSILRDERRGTITSHAVRKGLLKRVARRHFPPDIVDRPKQGFAIPIGEWFRTDFGGMRQLMLDHLRSSDPFPGLGDAGVEINMKFVEQMIREHDAAGEKSINPWHGRDHSQRLYMLTVLSIWAKWLERVRREASA